MAPSRRGMLALLSLVASIHAAPAPLPAADVAAPSDQIGLQPPDYSISWDLANPVPKPTKDPKPPKQPIIPIPTPEDHFSLHPPTVSISWDGGDPGPKPTPEPEVPIPHPKPSDQVSLGPPSHSVSWDLQSSATPTPTPSKTARPGKPTRRPRPTRRPTRTNKPTPAPSTSSKTWPPDHPPSNIPELPEQPEYPGKPEEPIVPPVLPPVLSVPEDSIGLQPPKATVSWGFKRQFEYDPEVTEVPVPEEPVPEEPVPEEPEWPEDPEEPEWPEEPEEPDFPPIIIPTPPNSIGIQPPRFTMSWGKRQFEYDPEVTEAPEPLPEETELPVPTGEPVPEEPEEPEQTEEPFPVEPFPEDPEFPEEPEEEPFFPPIVIPAPSNSIGIQPPRVSFGWGKREAQPVPQTNSFGFEFTNIIPSFSPPKPTFAVDWDKRQAAETPVEDDECTEEEEPIEEPSEEEEPELPPPFFPTPTDDIGIQPPTAVISWGRRAAQTNDIGLAPATGSLIWGRDAEPAPQTDDIDLGAPTAAIVWGKGKREPVPEAETDPQFSLVFPTGIPKYTRPASQVSSAYISWGRREAEAQTDDLDLAAPTATIIWGKGKREPVPEPEANAEADPQFSLVFPTGIPKYTRPAPHVSSAYISWGRRDAEAEASPQFSLVFPTNIPRPTRRPKTTSAYLSWGRREADAAPEPTAAPLLADRAEALPPKCLLTTTVRRIPICPAIRCTHECPLFTPSNNFFEPVDPADVIAFDDDDADAGLEARGESSNHQALDCPVTVTETRKCPFCSCTKSLTKITLPTLKPFSTSKFQTSVKPSTTLSCPPVYKTIQPSCPKPHCPVPNPVACELSKVRKSRRSAVERRRDNVREIEKRVILTRTGIVGEVVPPVATITSVPLPTPVYPHPGCIPSVTKTLIRPCPEYLCVGMERCDVAVE